MKSAHGIKTFSLVMLSICLSGIASADTVVYSNLGPGNSYNTSPGTGWGVSAFQDVAAGFTGTGVNLSEVNVALSSEAVGTKSVLIELLADSGGTPDTTNILEQWTVNNIPTDPLSQLFDLTSVLHPFLASGTQYWLSAFPGANDTNAGWNWNSTGATGFEFRDPQIGPSWLTASGLRPTPAFSIIGVVPEPSSLMLLGSGALGLLGMIRRKLRA